MTLGFIGTGALTAAIVTGLKSHTDEPAPILLSPRNADIAGGLAARFADVEVAADNQAVLDRSDTVFLAVRPQVAHAVLTDLRFRADHHVVSLIATLSREQVGDLVAPTTLVTKALPMPMVAHRQGATIIFPPDRDMATLFGRLGTVTEVEDAAEFDVLSVATATFATYFKYLETLHDWLIRNGVDDARARGYVTALFKGLASAPETAPDMDFMHLSQDYATRGGLNEQVLRELSAKGLFEAFTESLDGIHRRIIGQ